MAPLNTRLTRRGFGGLGAAAATLANRRLLLFHHANLNSARLASQKHRSGLANIGGRQVEVLERVACGMGCRNIQRLEIVPLVFDLPGPSATVKPSRPMISLSSSIV